MAYLRGEQIQHSVVSTQLCDLIKRRDVFQRYNSALLVVEDQLLSLQLDGSLLLIIKLKVLAFWCFFQVLA